MQRLGAEVSCRLAAQQAVVAAFERSSRGHLAQLASAWRLHVDVEAAVAQLADKVAPLFELPCVLGAAAAGAPTALQDAMAAYGHALGLAFVLTDEYLDVTGVETPPSVFTSDLSRGVLGIPVLFAARDTTLRADILRVLEQRPSRSGRTRANRPRVRRGP